jgi:hypothetical protein
MSENQDFMHIILENIKNEKIIKKNPARETVISPDF